MPAPHVRTNVMRSALQRIANSLKVPADPHDAVPGVDVWSAVGLGIGIHAAWLEDVLLAIVELGDEIVETLDVAGLGSLGLEAAFRELEQRVIEDPREGRLAEVQGAVDLMGQYIEGLAGKRELVLGLLDVFNGETLRPEIVVQSRFGTLTGDAMNALLTDVPIEVPPPGTVAE